MIASFLSGAWIGGQALYWFFLRHQTELLGTQYWEALLLRIESGKAHVHRELVRGTC